MGVRDKHSSNTINRSRGSPWSAVKTSFGVRAAGFHGISLLGHLGNSLLDSTSSLFV